MLRMPECESSTSRHPNRDGELNWRRRKPLIPAETDRAEQDLLSHIQHGYELETDSLGGNPVLRHLKDNEEIRPLSANRNTIKRMKQRELITPAKVETH